MLMTEGAWLAARIMAILKRRFPNLTVDEAATLAASIVAVIEESKQTATIPGETV